MQREILFRGKMKDNGKWAYGSFVTGGIFGGPKEDCYIFFRGRFYDVIPETVGQYSGLKDKNGEGIYDGDLLKRTKRIDGNFIDRIFENYEVAYNPSIAGFEYKPTEGKEYKQYTVRPFGGEEIEITGNIHEVNPAVKDSVNINMKDAAILDPGTKQAEEVIQEAAAESAAQDQAMEATQDAEEGTTEG